jgi:RND family efflux transporter MFP subunit
MTRIVTVLFLIAMVGFLPGCGDHDHSHDDHGHPHDEEGGHAHGERPTVAVTHWTARSELFMEYPVFVAGESGRSAIHVTDLVDFSPLSEGEAVVVLRGQDGRTLEFRDGPSRPGIFGVDLKIDRPGVYDMSLRVDAPNLQDVHELGSVTVYAPGAALPAEGEEGEAISFLKEQQWTLDFGTAEVTRRGIRAGVTVPATVVPRAGGDAVLTAPVPGRIVPGSRVPVPGTRVRAGEVLARIAPHSEDLRDSAGLRAALVEAEQDHALAVQEKDRAARLVEARALPARRLDEAAAALSAAEARLEAALERWRRFESLSQSGGGDAGSSMLSLRAPFDGVISEVKFMAGVSVEAYAPLMRVVDPNRVHVVGAVPENLAGELARLSGAELVSARDGAIDLGKPLAVNAVIEPNARTAEVRFALDNREARLPVGQAAQLRLFLGEAKATIAVPDSAVVVDGGRQVVFVQTGGESFERRPVQLGDAAEGFVQVVAGVEPGERVVSRGAYLVRLAAMSTQIPAHGHVH